MKKAALILFACIAFSCIGNAQTETKTKGWYIEDARFPKYIGRPGKISYRYDKMGRQTLLFMVNSDSIVSIQLSGYDNVGNLKEKNTLVLTKDKNNPERYNCKACYFTSQEFQKIVENIFDQLEQK